MSLAQKKKKQKYFINSSGTVENRKTPLTALWKLSLSLSLSLFFLGGGSELMTDCTCTCAIIHARLFYHSPFAAQWCRGVPAAPSATWLTAQLRRVWHWPRKKLRDCEACRALMRESINKGQRVSAGRSRWELCKLCHRKTVPENLETSTKEWTEMERE